MTTTTLNVTGMSCGHCETAIVAKLMPLADVEHVDVDLTDGLVTVTSPGPIDLAGVRAAIEDAGYDVRDPEPV